MATDVHLEQLLDSWAAAWSAGRDLAPEDLCREHPELVSTLRELITRRRQQLISRPQDSFDPSADTTPNATPAPDSVPETASRPGKTPAVGQTFGRFELLGILGQGGYGTVYRAEDPELKRKIALKVLHAEALSRPNAVVGFLCEARALAAIQHDHVVPIYDVGRENGQLFVAMPLLAGETLASRLEREGTLPAEEIRRIGREIALGLSAIHARRLIHRDLKPANIWLEAGTGRVKVLDLGLAQEILAENPEVPGTIPYMSPEQVDSRPMDFRSDLFSLGTILYECATARLPFGKTRYQTILEICKKPVEPVTRHNPAIPGDLASLIERLLNKKPEERPSSAAEVARQLQAPATATPPADRRALILVIAASALVVVSSIFLLTRDRSRPTNPEPETPPPAVALEPLKIRSIEVRPNDIVLNPETQKTRQKRGHRLGTESAFQIGSHQAIDVKVGLSRPAYAYIVVFQADGKDHVLWPQDETDVPEKTDTPIYPSKRRDEVWGTNDGDGLWLVAVIASDDPLPSYRDWRSQHPGGPWKPHEAIPDVVMLDDGLEGFEVYTPEAPLIRGSRAAIKDPSRTPVVTLVNWLRQETRASVSALAFPVVPSR